MTEIVAFAMGGPDELEREPRRASRSSSSGNAVLMQSGSTAATATLGALYLALERGTGQHVDVATFETQNGSLDRRRYYLLSYAYSGAMTQRVSAVGRRRHPHRRWPLRGSRRPADHHRTDLARPSRRAW